MAEYERERQKAREWYQNSCGSLTIAEIARRIGRPASTVYSWKRRERWGRQLGTHNGETDTPVPITLKEHGTPKRVQSIAESAKGLDEKALLWTVILYQYAAIVRAQELMHVRDGDDTGFLTRGECMEGEPPVYEPRAAWDRHAAFMQAQSRAVAVFHNSLKAYQQLALGAHTADAREQQAKLLKEKVKKLTETRCPDIHIHTHIPRPPGTDSKKRKMLRKPN